MGTYKGQYAVPHSPGNAVKISVRAYCNDEERFRYRVDAGGVPCCGLQFGEVIGPGSAKSECLGMRRFESKQKGGHGHSQRSVFGPSILATMESPSPV